MFGYNLTLIWFPICFGLLGLDLSSHLEGPLPLDPPTSEYSPALEERGGEGERQKSVKANTFTP